MADPLYLNTPEALAEAVRRARAQQKLSQAQLAERAEVERSFVIELEVGKSDLKLAAVLRVLAALNIEPTALPAPAVGARPHLDLKEHARRFL